MLLIAPRLRELGNVPVWSPVYLSPVYPAWFIPLTLVWKARTTSHEEVPPPPSILCLRSFSAELWPLTSPKREFHK